MLALENTGRGFFLLPPVVGSRLSIDAGCDADLPGAPPWLPPGSSPHPSWWAYSPPATCLRWVRRCGRGARSAPCSWPPRMPMAGAPTDLVVDAPPRTPCACSPLHAGMRRSSTDTRCGSAESMVNGINHPTMENMTWSQLESQVGEMDLGRSTDTWTSTRLHLEVMATQVTPCPGGVTVGCRV